MCSAFIGYWHFSYHHFIRSNQIQPDNLSNALYDFCLKYTPTDVSCKCSLDMYTAHNWLSSLVRYRRMPTPQRSANSSDGVPTSIRIPYTVTASNKHSYLPPYNVLYFSW